MYSANQVRAQEQNVEIVEGCSWTFQVMVGGECATLYRRRHGTDKFSRGINDLKQECLPTRTVDPELLLVPGALKVGVERPEVLILLTKRAPFQSGLEGCREPGPTSLLL